MWYNSKGKISLCFAATALLTGFMRALYLIGLFLLDNPFYVY